MLDRLKTPNWYSYYRYYYHHNFTECLESLKKLIWIFSHIYLKVFKWQDALKKVVSLWENSLCTLDFQDFKWPISYMYLLNLIHSGTLIDPQKASFSDQRNHTISNVFIEHTFALTVSVTLLLPSILRNQISMVLEYEVISSHKDLFFHKTLNCIFPLFVCNCPKHKTSGTVYSVRYVVVCCIYCCVLLVRPAYSMLSTKMYYWNNCINSWMSQAQC